MCIVRPIGGGLYSLFHLSTCFKHYCIYTIYKANVMLNQMKMFIYYYKGTSKNQICPVTFVIFKKETGLVGTFSVKIRIFNVDILKILIFRGAHKLLLKILQKKSLHSAFIEEMKNAAVTQFGSEWGWYNY